MKLILQAIKALFRKIEASRTHWDTRKTVTKEYTFDGNIEGKETLQPDEYMLLVKIADTFPEISSITSLSVAATNISDGQVQEFELSLTEDVMTIADGIYAFADFAVYTSNGGELIEGVYIPSGLYLSYFIDDSYISKLSVTYNDGELKKLDKKYLPDEVINDIGKAQSTANNAQSTANNAQSTANNAQSRANNAQSTANNAQSVANSKMNANNPVGTGSFSMGRKSGSVVGTNSHAEGSNTTASGNYSHAEGRNTIASAGNSHAEGNTTTASGANSHAEGNSTTASGFSSHAEGNNTTASGYGAHAEGNSRNKFSVVVTKTDPTTNDIITAWKSNTFSVAKGNYSHVEGMNNLALGDYSHAEGNVTTASGDSSHAEGSGPTASGYCSHAEGGNTKASGKDSHAEGYWTKASGNDSHAEGYWTIASGANSHAEGNWTIASGENSHTQGKYNIEDTSNTYAHIVGNGTSDTARSNAHTVDWNGNSWYQGDVYVGGTNQTTGSKKLATEEYVNSLVPDLSNYATKEEIPVVPKALPNPNALTFTGAVNATYDGSEAVSVEIPSGGGGTDISLGLTSAAVGQTIKVKAVDESGKPTEWESVDFPSGGAEKAFRLVVDTTTTEDVAQIEFTEDIDGNPLKLKKFIFNIEVPAATGSANAMIGACDYRWYNNADTPQYSYYGGKNVVLSTSKTNWWGEICLNIEADGKKAIIYKRAAKTTYSNDITNSDGGTYHRLDVRYAPYSTGSSIYYWHETIDRIFYNSNSTTVMIPTGTKIKIWGVDA